FDEGGALKINADERSEACLKGFSVVPGLLDLVDHAGLAAKKDPATMVAACELILEGLVAEKRISRSEELGYTRVRPEPKRGGYGKPGPGAGPKLFTLALSVYGRRFTESLPATEHREPTEVLSRGARHRAST